MARITVAGYIGFGNGGDEALLALLVGSIRAVLPGTEICVLSARPRKTARGYGVESVMRYDPVALAAEFSRSDALVFCGGSLIQDLTSRRSLLYYLRLLRAARAKGMKTMLFANGIGPLTARGGRAAARVLDTLDVITLRDGASARTLAVLGVTRPKIAVTADTAFLLSDLAPVPGAAAALGLGEGERYAVISYRPWRNYTKRLTRECAALADMLFDEYGLSSVLLPMQRPDDSGICRAAAEISHAHTAVAEETLSPGMLAGLFSGAEITVGMRLHTLIYSAAAGTPAVGIAYDRKVSGLCRALGCAFVGVDGGEGELFGAVAAGIREREELSLRVRAASADMAARARGTVQHLRELLMA